MKKITSALAVCLSLSGCGTTAPPPPVIKIKVEPPRAPKKFMTECEGNPKTDQEWKSQNNDLGPFIVKQADNLDACVLKHNGLVRVLIKQASKYTEK